MASNVVVVKPFWVARRLPAEVFFEYVVEMKS